MSSYREAAAEVELRAEYCRTVFGQTDRVTKSMELAATLLSKLATGEWVLCPKEPTKEMCIRGATAPYVGGEPIEHMYKAMIAAAPELP